DDVVVLITAPVVAHGSPVHRQLQGGEVDLGAIRQAERGRLQVGQRPAGVPARQQDQMGGGVRGQGVTAAEPALIGERPAHHLAYVVIAERLEGEQERAGQQRADDGEERVLGGRADERYPAVLHRR